MRAQSCHPESSRVYRAYETRVTCVATACAVSPARPQLRDDSARARYLHTASQLRVDCAGIWASSSPSSHKCACSSSFASPIFSYSFISGLAPSPFLLIMKSVALYTFVLSDRPLSCIGDLHRGSRWTTYVRPVRRSELPGLDRLRRTGRVRRAEHMVSSFFSLDLSAPNWHFHLRFSQCLQATASSGVSAPVTSAPSADPAPPPVQSSVGSAPSSTSSTSTATGSPGATSFLIGVNIAYVILLQVSPITQLHLTI
jgi:hypothetical protein